MFPLYLKPIFPGTLASSVLQDEQFIQVLKEQMDRGKRQVGFFLTKEEMKSNAPVDPVKSLSDVHPIGMLGKERKKQR